MTTSERILLVESNPKISDFIASQALKPLGYQVKVVSDANVAIDQVVQYSPHLIISNVNLPGLSGKDLLVALNAQGVQTPVIVLAQKGFENNVIQAIRLGATDCIFWPIREAEVVSAVERALNQVRRHPEHRRSGDRLDHADQKLQQQMRALTTLVSVGKAVNSVTDHKLLFERVVEGAVRVSEADFGWLLLRDESARNFVLVAQKNLPGSWARKMGKPMDDGVSAMVALSGESLLISGEPLDRFRISDLGKGALVVPIKVMQEVIGLLVVLRKADRPFSQDTAMWLEAIADYASNSMVYSRLMRALQEAADKTRTGDQKKAGLPHSQQQEIKNLVQPITDPVDALLSGQMGPLTEDQRQALVAVQAAIQRILQIVSVNQVPQTENGSRKK